jgi:hypothetical protein
MMPDLPADTGYSPGQAAAQDPMQLGPQGHQMTIYNGSRREDVGYNQQGQQTSRQVYDQWGNPEGSEQGNDFLGLSQQEMGIIKAMAVNATAHMQPGRNKDIAMSRFIQGMVSNRLHAKLQQTGIDANAAAQEKKIQAAKEHDERMKKRQEDTAKQEATEKENRVRLEKYLTKVEGETAWKDKSHREQLDEAKRRLGEFNETSSGKKVEELEPNVLKVGPKNKSTLPQAQATRFDTLDQQLQKLPEEARAGVTDAVNELKELVRKYGGDIRTAPAEARKKAQDLGAKIKAAGGKKSGLTDWEETLRARATNPRSNF